MLPESFLPEDAELTTTPYSCIVAQEDYYFGTLKAMKGFAAKRPCAACFVLDRSTGEWKALA
jgi:hypothetical protein